MFPTSHLPPLHSSKPTTQCGSKKKAPSSLKHKHHEQLQGDARRPNTAFLISCSSFRTDSPTLMGTPKCGGGQWTKPQLLQTQHLSRHPEKSALAQDHPQVLTTHPSRHRPPLPSQAPSTSPPQHPLHPPPPWSGNDPALGHRRAGTSGGEGSITL